MNRNDKFQRDLDACLKGYLEILAGLAACRLSPKQQRFGSRWMRSSEWPEYTLRACRRSGSARQLLHGFGALD